MTDFDALAAQLHQHADFRVLRRLPNIANYCAETPNGPLRRALVIDVETTGLEPGDAIIELGLMLFTYEKQTGRVHEVLAAESWLNDPGRPIPAEIVKLTGITDDDVRGERIDDQRIRELADGAMLIIAHNASFDRPFVDRALPFLANRHWGCSMQDVPWRDMNVNSQKLDYLLYTHTHTFLDSHHRALDDCRATLHVLATAFANERTPLEMLLASCRAPRSRVAAVRSPFETKDVLRKRGYSWTGDTGRPPKTWCKEVLTTDLDAEVQWLRDHVYANPNGQPSIEKVDSQRRYGA